MPRRSKEGSRYPDDWKEIAMAIKEAVGWKCVRCGVAHSNQAGHTLGIHHCDLDPANNVWWNLLPLCAPCHLQIQHKVVLDRPWVLMEHSDWFKPYVAGFYAHKYLALELSRDEVEAQLPMLLDLERQAVLPNVRDGGA